MGKLYSIQTWPSLLLTTHEEPKPATLVCIIVVNEAVDRVNYV